MASIKTKIKFYTKKLLSKLTFFGINPIIGYSNIKNSRFFLKDLKELKKQKKDNHLFPLEKMKPILNERFSAGGVMEGHYFHQDLHVARLIYNNKPIKHLDIGSRTDGFAAHVATFRNLEIIDIRPIKSKVENITFKQVDLMKLPKNFKHYCDSISSLHAIEHFGLGRYNDPIDYFGHEKAVENIYQMLQSNGTFYFSVPIGPQRINFNAHRVFSISYLLEHLLIKFKIKSFSYVDDKGDFYKNVQLAGPGVRSNFNCYYGCGIFELIK